MTALLALASIPFLFGCCLWAAGYAYQRVRRSQFKRYTVQPDLRVIPGGKP
jgi:hypothetical protein